MFLLLAENNELEKVAISAQLPLEATCSVVLGFHHDDGSADEYCNRLSNFGTIGQCMAELLIIQQIFSSRFSGDNLIAHVSQR